MITVNLLPEEYKKGYKLEKARRFSVFVFLSLYFTIIIFSILLFGAFMFLKIETNAWYDRVQSEKSTEKVQKILALEESIRAANKKILIVNEARLENKNTSELMEGIAKVTTDNLYLKNVNINMKLGKVSMSGFANSRDDVLSFEKKLNNIQWIEDGSLVSPRSNILSQNDIDFTFSFKIKKDESDIKK